jgi:hypothetical protein
VFDSFSDLLAGLAELTLGGMQPGVEGVVDRADSGQLIGGVEEFVSAFDDGVWIGRSGV